MLRRLAETTEPARVQDTTFTHDVLGRYICSTWEEAVNNGGAPFDVVVLGAGMFGAYCAEKLYRLGAGKGVRVLVLDAGAFLVSEHVQNLARIGLVPPPATQTDPGIARNEVWGLPWRGNVEFPGLAYCLGGLSIYWGGWAPRLTADDLNHWPPAVVAALGALYPKVEEEIGVTPSTDFISGPLFDAVLVVVNQVAGGIAMLNAPAVAAPLAVQGSAPASGLFSFDKFSSMPLLTDAIREAAGQPDESRRLFLVPRAHVIKLHGGGTVTQIEVDILGQRRFLAIQPTCAVVLAASAVESTRLALHSFPAGRMGANLMVHLRSNTIARVRRAVFPQLPHRLETAALLVRGSTAQGRYHLQLTASGTNQAVRDATSEDTLFRMIPDLDLLEDTLDAQDPEWIVLTVRGIGEMQGHPDALPGQAQDASWINLSPYEADEYGVPRAWVQLTINGNDAELWQTMDASAIALIQAIAPGPNNVEYRYDNGWHANPPPAGKVRDGLGTTYHEAGTLWMGDEAAASITDTDGKFHHVSNAYAAGLALFPTCGSANPVLTALALAHRTAEAIVDAAP